MCLQPTLYYTECHQNRFEIVTRPGCCQLTSYGFLGPNHSTVDPSRPPVENDFSDYVDTGQTIAGLKYLVNLNISGLKIGDEVFEHLQFDDLRALNVSDNYSITSKGFKVRQFGNTSYIQLKKRKILKHYPWYSQGYDFNSVNTV